MLTLAFNGETEKAIHVSNCMESLRFSDEEGTVREFTAQINGKTIAELQTLVEGLTFESLTVFNGDTAVFTSEEYTKLISVTNNISLSAPSAAFLTLRSA